MRWTPDDDGLRDEPAEHGSDQPGHDPRSPTALGPVRESTGADDTDDASDTARGSDGEEQRTWGQELPRWLATLDSGRTRREYEKAVGYFFRTPGVPGTLAALTFDLLLAYRGSLALRAERQPQAAARTRATILAAAPRIAASRVPALPSANTGDEEDRYRDAGGTMSPPSRLAPATVNIRLTALRQFLAHCGLWGYLPDLPPDRIRAALRRLRIERRRPYQILAEPEWADFLRAAEAPRRLSAAQRAAERPAHADATSIAAQSDRGENPAPDGDGMPPDVSPDAPSDVPLDGTRWGVPRAVRLRRQIEPPTPREPATPPRVSATPPGIPILRRARSGLTGTYTAQRDHALLALALATGLRAIELCALDLGDIAREWNAGIEEWWLILPDAKTKGQHGGRTLPLAPALVSTLLEYARATGRSVARAADRATPLFLSRHHSAGPHSRRETPDETGVPLDHSLAPRRLTPPQVRRIVDRVETQWLAAQQDGASPGAPVGAETRAISPHALRHSTAIALLEGNERTRRAPASVEHVRGWLGHFDIRTTQGYLAHLDARRHRRPFTLQPVEERAATTPRDDAEGASPSEDRPPEDRPPEAGK